jgi:hypothetical protein
MLDFAQHEKSLAACTPQKISCITPQNLARGTLPWLSDGPSDARSICGGRACQGQCSTTRKTKMYGYGRKGY